MPPKRKPVAAADGESESKKQKLEEDKAREETEREEREKAEREKAEREKAEKEKSEREEREKKEREAAAAAAAAAAAPRAATPPIDPGAAPGGDARPICRYGANCFRKNPEHFKEYQHPVVCDDIVDEHQKMREMIRKKKEEEERRAAEAAAAEAAAKKGGKKKKAVPVPPPPPAAPAPVVIAAAAAAPAPALAKRASLGDMLKADGPVSDKKRMNLELYKELLKTFLSKAKLSVEEKRIARDFRRSHEITDSEHSMLIGQLGWSEDEYEDGERKQDEDIDIDDERAVLADPAGFKVFWVKKADLSKLSKAHENVFGRVCTKFFQTMAKAQANYTVAEIGVVTNTALKAKFDAQRLALKAKGLDQLEWGFHGTGEDAIEAICKTGFLHPDDIAKLNKGKAKKKKKIEVLDDGFYFGSGIYFSFYSDYAMWYSEERDSSQILLCKLLTGKTFKCVGRMDGKPCLDGYDSHFSPKGNEIVMFASAGCLPRYIIKFTKQDEQEREQED